MVEGVVRLIGLCFSAAVLIFGVWLIGQDKILFGSLLCFLFVVFSCEPWGSNV